VLRFFEYLVMKVMTASNVLYIMFLWWFSQCVLCIVNVYG
jgi:hypothetical protein